jgi:hypothetical protein
MQLRKSRFASDFMAKPRPGRSDSRPRSRSQAPMPRTHDTLQFRLGHQARMPARHVAHEPRTKGDLPQGAVLNGEASRNQSLVRRLWVWLQ